MSVFDLADPRHQHALDLLRTREIGWLGTNGRNGYPHAVPVWFLWHDDAILTFSQPHAAKARNLAEDSRAMFQLETADDGEDWLLLQGVVEFSDEPTDAWMDRVGDAYLAKYQAGLDGLGWSLPRLTGDFSLALILRPNRLILG